MRLQSFIIALVVRVMRGSEDRNQNGGLGLADSLSQTGEKVIRRTYVAVVKCTRTKGRFCVTQLYLKCVDKCYHMVM